MADPSVLACHDLTHGSTGATVVAKLHHHGPQGERVGHSRFGSCIWCGRGDDLHGEPTLVRAIRAEMESSAPIFPAQTCPSCGAEHPGQPCSAYEGDLFGGAL